METTEVSKNAIYARRWVDKPGNRERKRELNRRYYQKIKESGKLTKDNSERNRFRKHGITKELFQKIIQDQGNCCAICKAPGDWQTLVIDHDHQCCSKQFSCGKCIRGALCRKCNTALGLLGDTPESLQAAVDYVITTPAKDTYGYSL